MAEAKPDLDVMTTIQAAGDFECIRIVPALTFAAVDKTAEMVM